MTPITLAPPVKLGQLSDDNLKRLRVFVNEWIVAPERRGRLASQETKIAIKLSRASDQDLRLFLRDIIETQASRKRRAAVTR